MHMDDENDSYKYNNIHLQHTTLLSQKKKNTHHLKKKNLQLIYTDFRQISRIYKHYSRYYTLFDNPILPLPTLDIDYDL